MSRSSYPRKLRDQLDNWQAKIDQLTAHMAQAGAETRRQLDDRMQDLRAKQRAARRKLEQIEGSRGLLRRGADRGVASTRRKVHKTIQKITSGYR